VKAQLLRLTFDGATTPVAGGPMAELSPASAAGAIRVRLVWGTYHEGGGPASTFRALADRTLTNAAADPVDPQ
jgi:hypothetical protein